MNNSLDVETFNNHPSRFEIVNRQYSCILFINIFSTQFVTAAILSNLHKITPSFGLMSFMYYALTAFAAIPQSGLSDDYGRKRHLLISSSCVLVSGLILLGLILSGVSSLGSNGTVPLLVAGISPCILGVAGNSIPIARGCLTSLEVHDFRTAMAFTTTCIALGWIAANELGLFLGSTGVIVTSLIFQILSLFFIKKFYNPKEERNTSIKLSTNILDSYGWLIRMLLVSGGALAILAYFLSEIPFYQIYLIDELPSATLGKKISGSLMGFAYLLGVAFQSATYPSDRKCIKFGTSFSIISLFLLVIFNLFVDTRFGNQICIFKIEVKVTTLLQFFFAFGFGFFIPALFSMMAEKIKKEHIGRLFGAVDTTDTFSLSISEWLVAMKDKFPVGNLLMTFVSSILFFIAFIIYQKFIKVFVSYEKFGRKK